MDKQEPRHVLAEKLALYSIAIGLLFAHASQFFFTSSWSLLLSAVGAAIYVVGYVTSRILTERSIKAWAVSDVLLTLGLTLYAIGIFIGVWLITALGMILFLLPVLPRIGRFLGGILKYYINSYKELSQRDSEQAGKSMSKRAGR